MYVIALVYIIFTRIWNSLFFSDLHPIIYLEVFLHQFIQLNHKKFQSLFWLERERERGERERERESERGERGERDRGER